MIRLRLQGQSYSEIQKVVDGISKSTLSLWLKNLVLSDIARARLAERERKRSVEALIRRNKRQTLVALERRSAILNKYKSEVGSMSRRDLIIIGAALYWAEGHKRPIKRNSRELTNHAVSFTNADPQMLKIFLKFLYEICEIPLGNIKIGVRIFQHLNEEVVLSYWSRTLAIPLNNFTKTYIGISRSSTGKRPFNRLPYGVVQIRIYNTNLFHRIMGWIDGLKSQCEPR